MVGSIEDLDDIAIVDDRVWNPYMLALERGEAFGERRLSIARRTVKKNATG